MDFSLFLSRSFCRDYFILPVSPPSRYLSGRVFFANGKMAATPTRAPSSVVVVRCLNFLYPALFIPHSFVRSLFVRSLERARTPTPRQQELRALLVIPSVLTLAALDARRAPVAGAREPRFSFALFKHILSLSLPPPPSLSFSRSISFLPRRYMPFQRARLLLVRTRMKFITNYEKSFR